MTAIAAFDAYCTLLIEQMHYDVTTMSNQWMYWPLCVPALCYAVFFAIKWYCLLVPITLPMTIISTAMARKTELATLEDFTNN